MSGVLFYMYIVKPKLAIAGLIEGYWVCDNFMRKMNGYVMSEHDAQLLCNTLNDNITLSTRLQGILSPECPVPTISNENVLEEANRLIYGDRAAAYGPVTVSFERIAKFWEIILETKITAEQVGHCMIALKMSRQISKAGRDNIVDIAGYAGCIAKMEEEKTAV